MLNELLLALVGYPGPICQLDTRSNKIQLASDGNQFPFLHQSEKLQIDQICEIATLYYHLNRSLLQQDEDTNRTGVGDDVYMRALRNGTRVLLEPYKKTISKFSLPSNVPLLSLSYIISELKIYKLLFERLLQILRADHSMLTLFPHVHHMVSSGHPVIKHSGVHLCKYLNRVTLFQMQKFLIGDAHHPSFWIHRNEKCANWSNEYYLVNENIPPPLTVSLCRKFLFVSSVLHVLKRKSDIDDTLRANNYSREWYSQLQALSEFEQPSSFANQLELVITKMHNQITVYLWDILCGRDVKALFNDLRRCFLLDGDIFQVWLANGALSVLQQNTRLFVDSSGDLSRLFQTLEYEFTCMENVSLTTIAKASSILSPNSSLATEHAPHSPSGNLSASSFDHLLGEISKLKDQWHSQLQIDARIKWPLSLLITNEILELYNQIWQFLLLIKRVQMELNDCYMILIKSNNQANIVRSHRQQLHMIMHFLVDHIWYYLGVDVIGAQFSELEKFLSKCESFQACKVQHEQFLMRIHKSMFLGKSGQVVRATLLQLIDIIMTFTHVVRTEQLDLYLSDIDHHWRRQMSLFWNLLENGADRELSVLCLRIDYNGWFSRTGDQ